MTRPRFGLLILVPALLLAIYYTARYNQPHLLPSLFSSGLRQDEAPIGEGASDPDILNQLRLTSKIEYRRHCIHAHPTTGIARSKLARVASQRLATSTAPTVQLAEIDVLPSCNTTFTINVPYFNPHAQVDTSQLMLGVATTLKRMRDSLPSFARWLSYTGSTLLVLLVDQPDLTVASTAVEEVRVQAQTMGMNLIFEPYTGKLQSEGPRNFALAEALHNNIQRGTRWFGLVDDDTFFVSLPSIIEALAPFDPQKPYYIGALTEGFHRIQREGFKAWGGGGFFISPPLMKLVAANTERCLPLDRGFGDLLWRDCILEITSPTVPLTEIRGLNQIDMWGDISGYYESGLVPLLSVHHWKSWHLHNIPAAHVVADVAGPDSFLQRYLFEQDKTVLTNGFTIVAYPNSLPDLNLAELTMVENVGDTEKPGIMEFHHSLGKTRPELPYDKDKISWRFEQSVANDQGRHVRQFYVHRDRPEGFDSVIELDWRRE